MEVKKILTMVLNDFCLAYSDFNPKKFKPIPHSQIKSCFSLDFQAYNYFLS